MDKIRPKKMPIRRLKAMNKERNTTDNVDCKRDNDREQFLQSLFASRKVATSMRNKCSNPIKNPEIIKKIDKYCISKTSKEKTSTEKEMSYTKLTEIDMDMELDSLSDDFDCHGDYDGAQSLLLQAMLARHNYKSKYDVADDNIGDNNDSNHKYGNNHTNNSTYQNHAHNEIVDDTNNNNQLTGDNNEQDDEDSYTLNRLKKNMSTHKEYNLFNYNVNEGIDGIDNIGLVNDSLVNDNIVGDADVDSDDEGTDLTKKYYKYKKSRSNHHINNTLYSLAPEGATASSTGFGFRLEFAPPNFEINTERCKYCKFLKTVNKECMNCATSYSLTSNLSFKKTDAHVDNFVDDYVDDDEDADAEDDDDNGDGNEQVDGEEAEIELDEDQDIAIEEKDNDDVDVDEDDDDETDTSPNTDLNNNDDDDDLEIEDNDYEDHIDEKVCGEVVINGDAALNQFKNIDEYQQYLDAVTMNFQLRKILEVVEEKSYNLPIYNEDGQTAIGNDEGTSAENEGVTASKIELPDSDDESNLPTTVDLKAIESMYNSYGIQINKNSLLFELIDDQEQTTATLNASYKDVANTNVDEHNVADYMVAYNNNVANSDVSNIIETSCKADNVADTNNIGSNNIDNANNVTVSLKKATSEDINDTDVNNKIIISMKILEDQIKELIEKTDSMKQLSSP